MRFKRILTPCLLSSLLIVAMALPAVASTLSFQATTAAVAPNTRIAGVVPWYFPNESFQPGQFNNFSIVTNAVKMSYVPGADNTSDVVFTITNGLFQTPANGTTKYVLYDSTSGSLALSATGGSTSTATAGSSITFPKITVKGQHSYYLAGSGAGASSAITIAANPTTNATSLNMTVTQTTGSDAATGAGFIQFADYWKAGFASNNDGDKAVGTIDVSTGRTKLTGAQSATTDKATVVMNTNHVSASKYFVDLVSGNAVAAGPSKVVEVGTTAGYPFSSLTYTLGMTDITGISSVAATYAGVSQTVTTNATNKTYSITVNTTGIPADGNQIVFTITVDGTTVLPTRSFTMTVSAAANSGFNAKTYLNAASAGQWSVNGYQAYCPYVSTNVGQGFGTQFVLTNNSNVAADVFWDVITSSNPAVSANLSAYSNKQVIGKTQIPAFGSVLFDAAEVVGPNGLNLQAADTGGTFSRNQIRVTVTAGTSLVTGVAIQGDGASGKRTEPLMTSGSDTSYLKW